MCSSILPLTAALGLLLALLQLTSASPGPAGEAPLAFRLPRPVRPSHYDLYIETFLGDDDEGFKFQGHVAITLMATEPVQEIRLHAKDLDVEEESVELTSEAAAAAAPAVAGVRLLAEDELLVVRLGAPMPAGSPCRLLIRFSAPLGETLAGYYRSRYEHRATATTRWLAVTQFEATDARRAFPCFDEPSFKATFSITLAHLDKYSAISNMPVFKSEPMEGRPGWTVDHFERSLRMSTYLVAYLVSDLQHVNSATADNRTAFRVWAREEALPQAAYAASIGPRILSFFEHFFQVPYPLPKQDMAALPDFASGAMENWGLITYRERLLLLDEKASSVLSKRDVASVVAHELAHQWFGNLVTMRWWADLWLNEGFATYAATLGVHSVHPNWHAVDADALTNMLTVFRFDAVETSHPLSVELKHPNEIPQIFDTISYKKGSFLIRMMSHFLGEPVFREGLTSYLRKHRLDNAEQDDLWAALTAEAHRSLALPPALTVKAVMDSWTLQTGYPLLTLSRDYGGCTVSIQQSKYLSYQSSDPRRAEGSSCWEVPLTFAVASAPGDVQSTWLHCEGGTALELELPEAAAEGDWLLLNVNATGLFRVLYDDRGWELLAAALHEGGHIPALSRAQLLEDALALAWSGDLPYGQALRLLGSLRRETHFLPWKAALSALSPLYRLLRHSAGFGPFREALLGLMDRALAAWGDLRRPLPADDLQAFRHRALLVSWACRLGEPRCVRQARALFAEWARRQDPDTDSPLPHGLQYEVVCAAVAHGGEAQWRFAWQRFLRSNVASQRLELLEALACAREPWLLRRLLEWSIEEGSGIRRQDSATVFSSVAGNEYGFHIAKDFFFRNIARLRRLTCCCCCWCWCCSVAVAAQPGPRCGCAVAVRARAGGGRAQRGGGAAVRRLRGAECGRLVGGDAGREAGAGQDLGERGLGAHSLRRAGAAAAADGGGGGGGGGAAPVAPLSHYCQCASSAATPLLPVQSGVDAAPSVTCRCNK